MKRLSAAITNLLLIASVLPLSTAAYSDNCDIRGVAGFETGLKQLVRVEKKHRIKKDSVRITWRKNGSVAKGRFANCSGGANRRGCEVYGTHLYPEAGHYDVEVRYKRKTSAVQTKWDEHTETLTACIDPIEDSDFIIVSIGDSYYSGEGAPRFEKRLGEDTAMWDEPAANYNQTEVNRLNDGNGNDFIKAKDDDKVIDRSDEEIKTCHRSWATGSRVAARSLSKDYGSKNITLINMACSGATVEFKTIKDSDRRNTHAALNEQLDWARTRLPRIDALLMSGGGNNVGFSDKAKKCFIEDDRDPGQDFECGKDGPGDNSGDFEDLEAAYGDLSELIDCRRSGNKRGPVCSALQWTTEETLRVGTPTSLISTAYSAQSALTRSAEPGPGQTINTVPADIFEPDPAGEECYNFLWDPHSGTEGSLLLTKVSPATCGVYEQVSVYRARQNDSSSTPYSRPFPSVMYLWLGNDDTSWTQPKWDQRFIEMGDGTFQAEFYADFGLQQSFKIAGLEEQLIPAKAYINKYPDPTRKKNGTDFGSCVGPNRLAELHENLVQPLNETVSNAGSDYGWKVITMPESREHGICTVESWVVRPGESKAIQGDSAGIAHPNRDGFRYYGNQIEEALVSSTPPQTQATATSGGKDYVFGDVSALDVEVSLTGKHPFDDSIMPSIYYGIDSHCNAETQAAGACLPYEGAITIEDSGVHEISFYSERPNGIKEKKTWPVTVFIDKEPPAMTCEVTPSQLWPPNGKMVEIAATVTAVDEVFGPTEFWLKEILDTENKIAKDTAGFVLGTADVEGEVRAKRAGKGSGRTYTLVYESSDGVGNTGQCFAKVEVPHDQRP